MSLGLTHMPTCAHAHTPENPSRLLARLCCSEVLNIPWGSVCIKRTRGRKPFCSNKEGARAAAPNFNFNISHEVRVLMGCAGGRRGHL